MTEDGYRLISNLTDRMYFEAVKFDCYYFNKPRVYRIPLYTGANIISFPKKNVH